MLNLSHVKLIFNKGRLTIATAISVHKQGYSLICRGGQVDQILKETDE